MKKIINGFRFDTAKAKKLAEYEFGYTGDFEHVWEGLFKTANGAHFIAGKGGARSKYAEQIGQNEISGGADIRPVTKEQAISWCEKHGQYDVLEEHFADAIQDA